MKNKWTALAVSLILSVSTAVSAGAASQTATPIPQTETAAETAASNNGDTQALLNEAESLGLLPEAAAQPSISEETACLMEAGTGTIIYDKEMDKQIIPASTTKIMTALLVMENCSLDEQVTFTETGIRDVNYGSTNAGMQLGEVITIEQCLYLIMLQSANEVSAQVAEYIAGSEAAFVEQMNQRAEELGCTGTHFNNPNGLPDNNHYTTAHDMALISQEAIKHDLFREIIHTQEYTLPATNVNPAPRTFKNHHAILFPGTEYYYEYAIGGKTGYTDASQSTLVTFAEKDGLLFIATVFKGDGAKIVLDTKKLFEYGYENYEKLTLEGDSYMLVPKGSAQVISDLKEQKLQEEQELQEQKEQEQANTEAVAAARQASRSTYMKIIAVLGVLILLGLLVMIIKLISRRKKRRK